MTRLRDIALIRDCLAMDLVASYRAAANDFGNEAKAQSFLLHAETAASRDDFTLVFERVSRWCGSDEYDRLMSFVELTALGTSVSWISQRHQEEHGDLQMFWIPFVGRRQEVDWHSGSDIKTELSQLLRQSGTVNLQAKVEVFPELRLPVCLAARVSPWNLFQLCQYCCGICEKDTFGYSFLLTRFKEYAAEIGCGAELAEDDSCLASVLVPGYRFEARPVIGKADFFANGMGLGLDGAHVVFRWHQSARMAFPITYIGAPNVLRRASAAARSHIMQMQRIG